MVFPTIRVRTKDKKERQKPLTTSESESELQGAVLSSSYRRQARLTKKRFSSSYKGPLRHVCTSFHRLWRTSDHSWASCDRALALVCPSELVTSEYTPNDMRASSSCSLRTCRLLAADMHTRRETGSNSVKTEKMGRCNMSAREQRALGRRMRLRDLTACVMRMLLVLRLRIAGGSSMRSRRLVNRAMRDVGGCKVRRSSVRPLAGPLRVVCSAAFDAPGT